MLRTTAIAVTLFCGLCTGAAFGQAADDRNPGQQPGYGQGQQYGETGKEMQGFENVRKGVIEVRRDAVMRIRESLTQRGFQPAVAKPGEDELDTLRDTVKKYQASVGLKDTGKLDAKALHALGFNALVVVDPKVEGSHYMLGAEQHVTTRPAGLPKDAPLVGIGAQPIGFVVLDQHDINKIERELSSEGFLKGEGLGTKLGLANGQVTPDFIEALKRFQTAKGVKADEGLLNLATLASFASLSIPVRVTEKTAIELPEQGMSAPGTTVPSERTPQQPRPTR